MTSIEEFKQYLCPPGNGVFTVNTAKTRKESLHLKLFDSTKDIQNKWINSLSKLESHKGCVLLGVTSDSGGGIQRGANWGPLFLRDHLLKVSPEITRKYFDIGDIRTIPHLLHDKYLNESTIQNCRKALYKDFNSDLPVSPLSITERFCESFYKDYQDKGLLALGGDHSVSYPLVKPYLQYKKRSNTRVGLIHFDAHTDLLDERLGIDICFGSWTYHILNELYDTTDLYQLGIRSSGKERGHWERQFNINQFWTQEIKDKGSMYFAEWIEKDLKQKGIEEIYISFDIDALDAKYASSTGTPEKDGLEPHECHIIINHLVKNFKLTGADLVEVAPLVRFPEGEDDPQYFAKEPESTLEVGSQLIELFIQGINQSFHGNN